MGQPEERLPDVVDATRRTRLASERTFLAWWRSGLTALAVGIGAGKLVPEISGGSQWTFVVLGAGYALLGVVFIVFGYFRERALEQALDAFEGTVLAVTHDRWFARGFDRFLVLGADGRVVETPEPVWDVERVDRVR